MTAVLACLPVLLMTPCAKAGGGGDAGVCETAITGSSYGLGVMGGYGFDTSGPPRIDVVEVIPYVSFPLTGVVGEGFFRGVLEYKAEATLGVIPTLNDRGLIGLSPVGIRYNLTSAGRLVPFVEGHLGVAYADIPKHIQGTRFSFTESAGIGFRYFVGDKTAVELSGRFRHLSNAGMKEPNPGINDVYVLFGVSFY
jgi:Lipid A 3-O-deacylase (PagL)